MCVYYLYIKLTFFTWLYWRKVQATNWGKREQMRKKKKKKENHPDLEKRKKNICINIYIYICHIFRFFCAIAMTCPRLYSLLLFIPEVVSTIFHSHWVSGPPQISCLLESYSRLNARTFTSPPTTPTSI